MQFSVRHIAALLAIAGALSLAASSSVLFAQEDAKSTPAAQRVARNDVLIIAHRGDSEVAPENTLPAFALAVAAGSDLVELDYMHSADGVPVTFHDVDLDRTTNARRIWGRREIRLDSRRLSDLRRLDAGSWFDPRFVGTRIPTLSEALDVIQTGSMALVERKAGDPRTCVDLLADKKILDSVVVQAFDWEFLTGCHRLAPTLVLGALGSKELSPRRLQEIAATGASVVGWREADLDASSVAAIHQRGWKAWAWTVDDAARARELVNAGVDAIITNRPAAIRRALAPQALQQSGR